MQHDTINHYRVGQTILTDCPQMEHLHSRLGTVISYNKVLDNFKIRFNNKEVGYGLKLNELKVYQCNTITIVVPLVGTETFIMIGNLNYFNVLNCLNDFIPECKHCIIYDNYNAYQIIGKDVKILYENRNETLFF